ncbi:uracil-xanthine permease family protein [Desulforhabdus amnigena]|uniref:Uracil-xanthine permease n=1 Tax=Desulforhabdus amnigena TaxID=40218 RepID=A0A9W6CXY6_9BACT|nr:solute carrier family 23 protein [Desulforhabdus amnigena]NLJ28587.1 purine/pyrimidine permease [Deltaproteobacteria bacterium]GLI33856.1 uracil-xanthine permease [Desulforhabdus amnigena]
MRCARSLTTRHCFAMEKPKYIYDIDDHPPLRYGLVYGLQWAVIMFPVLIIVAKFAGQALHMDAAGEIRFFQLTLMVSGFFSAVQSLWGHRYPVLDGPASALLLTFIVLAPFGIGAIQGGTLLGGALLIGLVLVGKLKKIMDYTTPNVVGVILMLISFTLLPYVTRSMIGLDAMHRNGQLSTFLVSLSLVVLMAAFSHWFKGFWKTIALLLGMLLGTLVFSLIGFAHWGNVLTAPWISVPPDWIPAQPRFYWPAVLACASSYIAVIVNSLGSLHGIANLTDTERLPRAMSRCILLNGIGGIVCGFLGIVGTVSYSLSPGVVLANRVASRYTTAYCGVIFLFAAFVPKLATLLASVPAPVVGAALCAAMGAQVGAGLAIVSSDKLTGRDYFVVGLPVVVGTLIGFLPDPFLDAVPAGLRIFLGNGLIVGIAMVLLLEHVLMRNGNGS